METYSVTANKNLFLNNTDTKMYILQIYVISIYAFHSKYTIQNNVTNTCKCEVSCPHA